MVKLCPVPEGEALFDRVQVFINGIHAPVQCCRVSAVPFNRFWPGHQRPLDQTETAGFVSMDISERGEPANISVLFDEPVHDVWLRPLSRKVFLYRGLCSIEEKNSEVSFMLSEPGQYVLEINDHHRPVMFFVNPLKPAAEDDREVIRFGPGEHHPGLIRLKSNQTLLIEKGAVVYASVSAENARNIRVTGGGILDNSEFPRLSGNCSCCKTPLTLHACQNVEVSDIIIRDSCAFALQGFNLRNVHIDNVKIIGNWRYNSDGIDLFNSQNVVIENCFVRTYDDSIVIKGGKAFDYMNCENWIVRRCTVWNDWGHALEIGADTRADEYRNILFTDCDIIHHQGAAMDVQNNADAYCHDIVFDNIRVEYKKSCTPPEMQDTDESVYTKDGITDMPALMAAYIPSDYGHAMNCGDGPYGKNRHIVYRNIQAFVPDGMPERVPNSYFFGHSETEDTKDIVIDGLFVNGERITDRAQANISVGEYAADIQFR